MVRHNTTRPLSYFGVADVLKAHTSDHRWHALCPLLHYGVTNHPDMSCEV